MSVVKAGGLTQDRDAYRGSLRAARVEGRLLSQIALVDVSKCRQPGKVGKITNEFQTRTGRRRRL